MATRINKKNVSTDLRKAVAEIGREVSARTILMHQAIADKVGISMTELKCLDFVARGGMVTAGSLAEITGLTTGAITAMVDRLERAGLVVRERSSEDRRKVYIRPSEATLGEFFWEIYGPLSEAASKLAGRYSEDELALIYSYTLKSIELLKEQTERIRDMNPKKDWTKK